MRLVHFRGFDFDYGFGEVEFLFSLLPGLASKIEAVADIPAFVVDDPLRCVIRGAAEVLEHGYEAK